MIRNFEIAEVPARVTVFEVIVAIVLLPLAILGVIANYPTYRLIGFLAKRLTREDEIVATIKFIAAATLFPLTWIALGFIHPWFVLAAPLSAYVAMRVFEVLGDAVRRARPMPAG